MLSTPGSAIPATLRQHHLPRRLLTETNEPPVPATAFTPHCRGERGSARGPSAWGQPRDTPLRPRMGPPPHGITSSSQPRHRRHGSTVLLGQLPGRTVGLRSAANPRHSGTCQRLSAGRGMDGHGRDTCARAQPTPPCTLTPSHATAHPGDTHQARQDTQPSLLGTPVTTDAWHGYAGIWLSWWE